MVASTTRSIRNEDYIRKLADYVKKNSAKGYAMDTLRWALVKQGHTRTCVEKAVEAANREMAAFAPKLEEKPVEKKKPVFIEAPKECEKKGFFARIFGGK